MIYARDGCLRGNAVYHGNKICKQGPRSESQSTNWKGAKALMQAISESSLVLRVSASPARSTSDKKFFIRTAAFTLALHPTPERGISNIWQTIAKPLPLLYSADSPTPSYPISAKAAKCLSSSPLCAAMYPPSQSAPSRLPNPPNSRA